MSRVGKRPIKIPEGVTVEISQHQVTVKGKLGELTCDLRPEVKVAQKDNEIKVELKEKTKSSAAFWGLTRALINNMIKGVSEGFEKRLELVGVGYRAKQDSSGVSLTLGYSHPVLFERPEGVEIIVEDNKNIIVKGADKQLVGQTAANIRALRKPEPYKGKGIRYKDELVRTKPGKAGKIV